MPTLVFRHLVRRIVGLHLAFGLGLTISLGLAHVGIPWLAHPIGLLALFLPGLNLALALEQLALRREPIASLCLWAAVFTFTLTPAATSMIGQLLSGLDLPVTLLVPFGLWWILTLCGFLIVHTLRGFRSGFETFRLTATNAREFWIVGLVFLAILVVNFVIYPFIPEGDGYGYLLTLRQAAINPAVIAASSRGLFLVLVQLTSQLMTIDPYWILKAVLPLGAALMVVPTYLVSGTIIRQPWLRAFVAFTPLFLPVVLQETLISRPQSAFLFTLLPVLYLVGTLIRPEVGPRASYWFLALLGAGLAGIQLHALFALFGGAALFGLILVWWPVMRRQPLDAAFVLLGVGFLLSPWVSRVGILGDLVEIALRFGQALHRYGFTFWFIDSYHNVDGLEVGWPGWSALFYYGYNLGLFLPTLLLLLLLLPTRGALRGLGHRAYWPVWVVVGLFFTIAEVLPRFGFAYLPDRAWLFIVLAVSLMLPAIVQTIVERRRYVLTLLVVGALSLGVGTALTYAKQGRISRASYAAVPFIRTQIPKDALFLGQGANRQLVGYYGERAYIVPPPGLFLSDDPDAVDRFIAEQRAAYAEALALQQAAHQEVATRLTQLGRAYRQATSLPEQRAALDAITATLLTGEKVIASPTVLGKNHPVIEDIPLYLIYSDNLFNSLYGTRAWWRSSNFYGANVDKFTTQYPIVYQDRGTTIWKVRD